MRFGVLGPLLLIGPDGNALVVAPPQQRTILRVLLARSGQVVSSETLAAALWGEAAGQQASGALRALVHHLRRTIGADRIVHESGGYVLVTAAGELDAHEFRDLVERAGTLTAARDLVGARDALRQALGLWRGPAYADDDSCDPVRSEAVRLNNRRLTAYEDLFDLELGLGSHREICAEIEAMVREEPLRERFVAQAMSALANSGRRAEALHLYDRTRRLLAEELGVDPGARIRDLHAALLTSEQPTPVRFRGAVPRQLPPVTAHFTARLDEIEQLSDRLRATGDGPALCGIAGMGGIGKTALAVKVGCQLADDFPDGQLFVDLRGAGSEAAEPGWVLGTFLRALGVATTSIPDTTDERMMLFRSRCAGQRILVVLDNAASEAQVRPLLPATDGCAAMITSRSRMPALDGVQWIDLGLLSQAEGIRLLNAVGGVEPVEGDPAAAEVVVRCGRLPLAVRIAGARVIGRPQWNFARLAEVLRDEQRRIDELAVGDLAVRSSIALSYRALSAETARLFRRLGLLDCGDLNAWVAAALLDMPSPEAERLVEQLVDAQLLLFNGTGPGWHLRYRMHDLVRLFAHERAIAEEPQPVNDAALTRTWTMLAGIAGEADRRSPLRMFSAVHDLAPGGPAPEPWAGDLLADPMAWFDAERSLLLTAARATSDPPVDDLAWRIPAVALLEFQTRGLFQEWRETHQLGLEAAVKADDVGAQALMHRNLGLLEVFGVGDCHQGLVQAEQALRLFGVAGVPLGQADALCLASSAHTRLGNLDLALSTAAEGVQLARTTSDRRAEANLLQQVGWVHRMRGDLEAALEPLTEAGQLARDGGFTRLSIWLASATGIVQRKRGELADAEFHLQHALALAREARTDGDIANLLANLASLQYLRGDLASARANGEEGLHLSRVLGSRLTEGLALLALAEVETSSGDLEHARELLTDASDLLERMSSVFGQARARQILGAVEQAAGRPAEARAALLEARRLFLKAGSSAEAAAVDVLLKNPTGT